jgi:hypothetical protein
MNIQDMLNPQEKAETFPKRPPMHDKSTQTADQIKETTEKLGDTVSTSPSTTSTKPQEYDLDKPIESTESPNE